MGKRNSVNGGSLRFRWLSGGRIPHEFDLRRCGWVLLDASEPWIGSIGVVLAGGLDSASWMHILGSMREEARRLVLVVGVEGAGERSNLLQFGFGDALGHAVDIVEVGARAVKVAEHGQWLPRTRRLSDALLLDLLAREAFGHGKALNLNPREFALIWRLSDAPNQMVTKQALIQDVWRMGFVPETNSIAVHMSRLRRKLSFVGLENIIETASPGGYRLTVPEEPAQELPEVYGPVIATGVDVTAEAALQHWKH